MLVVFLRILTGCFKDLSSLVPILHKERCLVLFFSSPARKGTKNCLLIQVFSLLRNSSSDWQFKHKKGRLEINLTYFMVNKSLRLPCAPCLRTESHHFIPSWNSQGAYFIFHIFYAWCFVLFAFTLNIMILKAICHGQLLVKE